VANVATVTWHQIVTQEANTEEGTFVREVPIVWG
jgi:hypothetical protein